jgi:hypothetical protein
MLTLGFLPGPSTGFVLPGTAPALPYEGPGSVVADIGAQAGAVLEEAARLLPVKLDYVSPSALETFDAGLDGLPYGVDPESGAGSVQFGCQRKWAWSKLDRVPKVQGASAIVGSQMHSHHERYLLSGTPYDLTTRPGELAAATRHLVPEPGTARVEQEIRFSFDPDAGKPGSASQSGSAGPILFGGKLDANWLEYTDKHTGTGGAPGVTRPLAIVLDHKSTSDIARYAKLTKSALLAHPQAPIYGVWAALEYGTEWVELRWNYVETRRKTGNPKIAQSWHVVHRDELAAALEHPARVARRLLQVVQQANEVRASGRPFGALDLPPNPNHCAAFGGCQFRDRCNLSAADQIRSHIQMEDFFATLRKKEAPPSMPAPAVPVQAAPVQVQPNPTVPLTQAPAPVQVQGYGAQINPPESAAPVPVQSEAPAPVQAAAEPAPAAAPKGKAGPGRGHKKAPEAVAAGPAAPEQAPVQAARPLEEECLIAAYRSGMALQGAPDDLARHVQRAAAFLRAQGAA